MSVTGNLIIDLQFGSTGKGLIAGFLAERDRPDTVVTAWAANAGHTYIDASGRKFVHTMLANGVVSPRLQRILIGPGSLIDPEALIREVRECEDLLKDVEIFIHPNAAIITQRHRDEEAGPMTKIGSTKKGVGAAAIQRIQRNPDDLNVAYNMDRGRIHNSLASYHESEFLHVCPSPQAYQRELAKARVLQVEGAQGHSLSMYNGFYPYTTSRDVSVHQTLADCAIPLHVGRGLTVVGTARTYPIRVANRFDESGNMVGWSGPCYDDQEEISFADIGQEVELTTVTKLPRRIFTFSHQQLAEAVHMNGVDELFLNFVNYLPVKGVTDTLNDIADTAMANGAVLRYMGHGPSAIDVTDSGEGGAPFGSDR